MTKNIQLQYVTDQKGNKTGVLIPIEEWDTIQRDLNQFFDFLEFKSSLQSAFQEVKLMRENKLPKITLKEFLDDC